MAVVAVVVDTVAVTVAATVDPTQVAMAVATVTTVEAVVVAMVVVEMVPTAVVNKVLLTLAVAAKVRADTLSVKAIGTAPRATLTTLRPVSSVCAAALPSPVMLHPDQAAAIIPCTPNNRLSSLVVEEDR